jgi:hypothetical protein
LFESEADRLALVNGLGGEEFDTGKADRLLAIFERETVDSLGQMIPVQNRRPMLTCRESDATLHELVKGSRVVRIADKAPYIVATVEPDGSGMCILMLRG